MKLIFSYHNGGINPVLGQVYHGIAAALGGDRERYQNYLANSLSNLASEIEDCERILMLIDKILRGDEIEIEIEGEDVDVILNITGVQVDITLDDDWIGQSDGRFELNEFRAAIIGWKDFLALPESFESVVEVDLKGLD